MKKTLKSKKGITLIALVVTIIILIILAGVSINLIAGQEGIFQKSQQATEEYKKKAAQETIELKVSEIDMNSLMTTGKKATLQNIADALCNDEDIEYVVKVSKKTASLEPITLNDSDEYIYTKLKAYSYELGVNKQLKVAKLDGQPILKSAPGGNTPEPEKTKVAVPTLSEGKKTYTGSEQTVTVNGLDSDKVTQTGTISATNLGTYTVTWNLKDTENCVWEDQTTEPKTATWKITNPTLVSQITAANYGDKVNYSVTVEGVTLDNWKIFYKNPETNEVIMVYNDYLPNSTGIAANAGLVTYGDYKVYSNKNRSDLITILDDPTNTKWTSLLNGNEIDLSGKATAKGAVDLDTWVESWNAKGYQELHIAKKTGMSDSIGWGYYVGTSENPTTSEQAIGSNSGYNDELYFPHKDTNKCWGYWLASPSAMNSNAMMGVGYNGRVSNFTSDGISNGVCPAVYLTSDVLTSGKDASGAWVIE